MLLIMLSIIIPGYNDPLLQKTTEREIEVALVLDGYWYYSQLGVEVEKTRLWTYQF